MSNTKYNRGSEWRKWDLHIHTPFTKLNNNFIVEKGDVWDEYCKKIHDSDVEVFAITDYFSADNYFIFLETNYTSMISGFSLLSTGVTTTVSVVL